MNVYRFEGDIQNCWSKIENAETQDEIDEAFEDLCDLSMSAGDVLDEIARMKINLEATATALRAESRQLAVMAALTESKVERLKKSADKLMTTLGEKEMQTSIGTWRFQKNNPSCEVKSIDLIPAGFLKPQPPKVDAQGMIDHWKLTGEEIPGVEIKQEVGLRFVRSRKGE